MQERDEGGWEALDLFNDRSTFYSARKRGSTPVAHKFVHLGPTGLAVTGQVLHKGNFRPS